MKKYVVYTLLNLLIAFSICFTTHAQSVDTAIVASGNSCQPYFDNNKKLIHYSYTALTQTHNYSNNWDFDGDSKKDELYFIGTGGAHLYFYLRIVLSSDKKVQNFPFLELDMPCLGSVSELNTAAFIVGKFISRPVKRNGSNDEIYLRLDNSSAIPLKWKKRGVNSNRILVVYEMGKIIIKNYNPYPL